MTEPASKALEERLRSTREQIDALAERERAVNSEIGSALANGGEVAALRDERREVRDLIEDLSAALPHLERQLNAARVEDSRAALLAWLQTEREQVARATAIGRELRLHMDALCILVPELSALLGEHSSMTRPTIGVHAKNAGERQPSAPDLVTAAGLSSEMAETTLPAFVQHVQSFRALHRS